MSATDPITERLEDQINWYNRKSSWNQRAYKRIKTVEIVAAALIPFIGVFRFPWFVWVTGALGAMITVFEGLLHLNQYQQNWTDYRSTCESLNHEKYVFLAKAPTLRRQGRPPRLLAERIESLVSQEHAKWASMQRS